MQSLETIMSILTASGSAQTLSDPLDSKKTITIPQWTEEQYVAKILYQNYTINKQTTGYEIAQVKFSNGAIEYFHVDKLKPPSDEHVIISVLDCSNPTPEILYLPTAFDDIKQKQAQLENK